MSRDFESHGSLPSHGLRANPHREWTSSGPFVYGNSLKSTFQAKRYFISRFPFRIAYATGDNSRDTSKLSRFRRHSILPEKQARKPPPPLWSACGRFVTILIVNIAIQKRILVMGDSKPLAIPVDHIAGTRARSWIVLPYPWHVALGSHLRWIPDRCPGHP